MKTPPAKFDALTICLHWISAITFLCLFAIGAYMVTLDYYDPQYVTLPYWHKGIGILLMLPVAIHVVWRFIKPRPEALPNHQPFEKIGASIAHWALGLGYVLVLISGYLIPTAAGAGINVLDLFTLPALNLDIADQEDNAGLIHQYAAYAVLAIATVHAAAALKHHLFDKDMTLRRMLPGRIQP